MTNILNPLKSRWSLPLFIVGIVILGLLGIVLYTQMRNTNEYFLSSGDIANYALPKVASHISSKAHGWVSDKTNQLNGSMVKVKEDWNYLNGAETFEDLEKRWEQTKAEYVDSLVNMGIVKREEHFAGSQVDNMATLESIIRSIPSYESATNDIFIARSQAIAVNNAVTPADMPRYMSASVRMRYDLSLNQYIVETQCAENKCEENATFVIREDGSSNSLIDLRNRYKSQIDLITNLQTKWNDIKVTDEETFMRVIRSKVPPATGDDETIRKSKMMNLIKNYEAQLQNLIDQWAIDKRTLDTAIQKLQTDKLSMIYVTPATPAPARTTQVTRSRGRMTTSRTQPTTTAPAPAPVLDLQPASRTPVKRTASRKKGGVVSFFTNYMGQLEGFLGFNREYFSASASDSSRKSSESASTNDGNYTLLDLGSFVPPYMSAMHGQPLHVKTWSGRT
jgi:hypothetical protein